MGYRSIGYIGGRGPRPDQFTEALRGLCVDGEDLLYAVGDRQVKVFDPNRLIPTECPNDDCDPFGRLQRTWETHSPPYCVAVDARGAVHVGEPGRIERFDAAGKLVDSWVDAERLGLVTTIDFFGDFVLVADARDRCIRRYHKDGRWLNNIGKDNRTKGFLIPNGRLEFAVDGDGIIHASNAAKHRVERYSLEGELLGHFGRFGTRRPQDFPGCCNPTNLTLTPQGQIVVTEKAGPRVKVFDRDGTMRALIGPQYFDPNCKNNDVAVDADGLIYVADTVRLWICVFAPAESDSEKDAEHPAATGADRP